MSNVTRRCGLLSCCGSAALVVLVAAAAASGCAGPQSARIFIDGREYFAAHGKRARTYGPAPRTRIPGGTEGEIVRALARISNNRLRHDSRLQRIAELYFDDVTETGFPGEARSFFLRYHGLTEATVTTVRFEAPSAGSLVNRIADWGRRVLRGSIPVNRTGVVVRPVRGPTGEATVHAVMMFARHYLDVDPIRQRVKRGEALRLRARLLAPFVRPKVSVTGPDGAVAELAVPEGGSIDVTLPTGRRGRMDVRISAEHSGETVTVAAFPIWVGRSPPSRLRLPRPESSEAFSANIIRLTNEERAKVDLAPLEVLPLLGRVALADARDAASRGVSERPGVDSRLRAARFCGRSVTESAFDFRTAAGLVRTESWSNDIRRLLTDPDVTHMGVGAVAVHRGGDRITYVTQIFARRGWTLGRTSCEADQSNPSGTARTTSQTAQPAEPAPPAPASPPPPAPAGSPQQEAPPVVPNPSPPPVVPPGQGGPPPRP